MSIDLARIIDHTCLKPDATVADIETLCAEAIRHGFHAVCVAPARVTLAHDLTRGADVKVCTVVGFPHGNTTTAAKGVEAQFAVASGADELDMVINIGALRDNNLAAVREDIRVVAGVAHQRGGLLKVIVETCLLTPDQIKTACDCAVEAGADFVKTSTGFAAEGATVENVRLMRSVVPDHIGVKAAGGIRDAAMAIAMVEAGATRIGASASLKIIGAEG